MYKVKGMVRNYYTVLMLAALVLSTFLLKGSCQ